ncbi:MAG: hypothetical protein ACN6NX_13670 [Acinetobacter sp.]
MSQEYITLLKIRKYYVIGILIGIPIFLLVFFQIMVFFNFGVSVITLLLIITCLFLILFSTLFFLSKDICPWCKESFFNGAASGDGISLIFRRNCQHCGMPKKGKNQ